MPITETDIARSALIHIGDKYQLKSLDDATPQAKAVKHEFASTRDAVLREYAWAFAKVFIHPSSLTDPPPTPAFKFAYLYPADCLKVISVKDYSWVEQYGNYANYQQSGYYDPYTHTPQRQNAGFVQYEIMRTADGKQIVATNCSDIQIEYTRRVENPNEWDTGFQKAFSYWLASEVAIVLTGSKEMRGRLRTEARRAIEMAAEVSANESSYPNRYKDASWLSARTDGGYHYGDW